MQTPATLAHIVTPVTYGAGTIGFRTIGFRGFHVIPMSNWKLELAAEIAAGKWNDANSGTYPDNVFPGNNPKSISAAWASGAPQFVGRVKADGKAGGLNWMGFASGSYESIDLRGFGNTQTNGALVTLQDGTRRKKIDSYAVSAGGQLRYAPVVLMLQGYTGRATAPLLASLIQFGDIGDTGYWAQLGVFASKELSLWVLYGASFVDKKDLQNWANPSGTRLAAVDFTGKATALRKDNRVMGGMLQYKDSNYAYAVEYYDFKTNYLLGNLANDDGTRSSSAYQVTVSGGYFF